MSTIKRFDSELKKVTAKEVTRGLNKAILAFADEFRKHTGIELPDHYAYGDILKYTAEMGHFGTFSKKVAFVDSKKVSKFIRKGPDCSFRTCLKDYHNSKVTTLAEKANELTK